jgi:hypothetical protein
MLRCSRTEKRLARLCLNESAKPVHELVAHDRQSRALECDLGKPHFSANATTNKREFIVEQN